LSIKKLQDLITT